MLSARELEFILYEHPAVWDVAVVDQPEGEAAVFVQPRQGQRLDSAELVLFCRAKLGETKAPKNLYVVNSLPKTKTGKVSRLALLEIVQNIPALSY